MNGPWIDWEGGRCPTTESVKVRLRSGREYGFACLAGLSWDRVGSSGDIVAYQLRDADDLGVKPIEPKRRVYISGPMSGYPGWNFATFNDAALQLRAMGYEVCNPVDINTDVTTPWAECLKADLAALLECTDVACLSGWELSRGAQLEVHVAMALNIPCRPIGTFHKVVA